MLFFIQGGSMERKWWKEAVGYQIYPRSFKDTNNDGIGDLQGIIEKLDYIEQLGVNLVWICPFYKSPMDDNGYDVSDFYDVDPLFGSMDDAKELISKAHEKGIHIILDLVMNQTSDEHPWFVESRKSKDNQYRDYYIWQDGKVDTEGNRIPPNNWASFFEGSCWNFDELTGQYYMKIFSNKMPDLNWENTTMRKEMAKMAQWWLDLGVDGFRVDAIAHLAKDTTFADSDMEVENGRYAPDWKKFSNRERLFDYLAEFHESVLSNYDCVTVGEVGGGADVEDAVKYAGYDVKGFNMVFNFDHCWHNGAFGDEGKTEGKLHVDVVGLRNTFDRWIQGYKGRAWIPQYWLNHDHPRVLSQYGDIAYHRESGSMLATVLLALPGTPFIYNGEEIGMTNVDYHSVSQFKDVWVRNYVSDARQRLSEDQILRHLCRTSRDNARTPMQWNAEAYAGFSEVAPHLDVVGNYSWINVEVQQNQKDSILNHYRRLIHLRRPSEYKDILVYGDFELIFSESTDVFAFTRTLNSKKVAVVANFRSQRIELDMSDCKELIINNETSFDVNYLLPYQAVVYQL